MFLGRGPCGRCPFRGCHRRHYVPCPTTEYFLHLHFPAFHGPLLQYQPAFFSHCLLSRHPSPKSATPICLSCPYPTLFCFRDKAVTRQSHQSLLSTDRVR